MSRRSCNSGWLRRWRGVVWCCVCLVCLALLALWDTLGYLFPSEDHRTRHCPPPPVEADGCTSWRPLLVPHPTCSCTRKILVLHDTCTDFAATDPATYITYTREYYGTSHCSDQATLRGPRQHVVSLSIDQMTFYDLTALNQTINQVNNAYKGWLVRVYAYNGNHNHPGLCSLVCNNPNLDLCDTKSMAKPPKSITRQGRTGWRWAVLGDPLVSVWIVRYVEMEILEREALAVTQFINSDKCWHLMKDHPSHAYAAIGSGLIGGKTSWGESDLRRSRRRLTNEVHSIADEETVLEDNLIPVMGNDAMTHDSVTCHKNLESVPYPSKRQPGQWVGMPATSIHEDETAHLVLLKNKDKQSSDTKKSPLLQKINMQTLSTVRSLTEILKGNSSGNIESIDEKTPEKDRDKKSMSEHKKQTNKVSLTTKSPTVKSKVPQEPKTFSHSMYLTKERELNREKGILECPKSCRPHHHPDWQYC